MIRRHHHHIPSFEGNQFFSVVFRHEKGRPVLMQLNDVPAKWTEKGMMKKYIPGQQGLPQTCRLGRFIENQVILDNNADITGENEIGNRGKKQRFI